MCVQQLTAIRRKARDAMPKVAARAIMILTIGLVCQFGLVPLEGTSAQAVPHVVAGQTTAPRTPLGAESSAGSIVRPAAFVPALAPENAVAEDAPLPEEKTSVEPTIEDRDREPTESVAVSSPLPSSGLTLDQVINLCLTNDPRICAGVEAVNQAHGDAWTASLRPNPEVGVAGGLLPLSRAFTPDAPAGPSEFEVGVSYGIDWFLFGKRAAAMASATMGICVSEAEYADLVRQRVTETALAFYDVLEAKDSLELARQDLANLERVEAVTRKAVDNGGLPQVELNRVRLELLARRRELRDAESTLITGKAKLRALVGGAEADPGFDVAGTLDGPLTAEPLPVEEAYAMAQQNRPDLLALRRKIARAQADALVEQRNALPEVTSDWALTHQFQQPIGAPDATMWGTALTMTVPLFNRNQGNRAKAASVVAQSNHELRAGLVELRAEIEESVQSLHTARQNAASVAQEELRLAAQVRDAIGKAYEAGGRPLIDVLDAQRNFRETYRIYITSRAEYWRSLYRFNSAIGRQVAR
jgi:cobalt-zinc-cadmium efflux system outer membrane protein